MKEDPSEPSCNRIRFDRIHTFEHRPSQTSPALLCRNAAWIAVGRRLGLPIEHGLVDRRTQRRRGGDLPRFLKIASLTVTRPRCSTFGNGPGLCRHFGSSGPKQPLTGKLRLRPNENSVQWANAFPFPRYRDNAQQNMELLERGRAACSRYRIGEHPESVA